MLQRYSPKNKQRNKFKVYKNCFFKIIKQKMFKWKYCKNLDKDNNPLLLKKKKKFFEKYSIPCKTFKIWKGK